MYAGVGTERGLKVLAKVFFGVNVARIKELAGIHRKNMFDKMSDLELEYGKTRVSDWVSMRISAEQAFYLWLH